MITEKDLKVVRLIDVYGKEIVDDVQKEYIIKNTEDEIFGLYENEISTLIGQIETINGKHNPNTDINFEEKILNGEITEILFICDAGSFDPDYTKIEIIPLEEYLANLEKSISQTKEKISKFKEYAQVMIEDDAEEW